MKPTAAEIRALRERHNCTDAANGARLVALVKGRQPAAARAVLVRRWAWRLPALVRAEAQVARAGADALDPKTMAEDRDYRRLTERAHVLEGWAKDCEFASVREAAAAAAIKILQNGAA